MNVASTLSQVIVAYSFAIIGGVLSASLRLSHKSLCALITLAAGTLIGVTLFAIIPESLEAARWWQVLISAGTGYALFFLISKYVYHVCPACAASHFDESMTKNFTSIARLMMIALAVHSTTDGLAISAGNEAQGSQIDPSQTNWSLLLALCIHKVPEGLALGSILVGAGFRRIAVVGSVIGIEATTVAGGVIGIIFFNKLSFFWLGLIMAHVGGGFIYLAAHAILGEMLRHEKKLVLVNFILGFALIAILNVGLRFLAH
jgi:zinc transporter ZupT